MTQLRLGTNPTIDDLLTELGRRLEAEDGEDTFEAFSPSASPQNSSNSCISKWSERVGKSTHINHLIRGRRNALPAVNRLPYEMLGEIFLYLQAAYINKSFQLPVEKSDIYHANSWIKVAHVCQCWRRTAHNTKTLWSRIVLDDRLKSPAFMATSFLSLSYPLSIKLEHELGPLSENEEEKMNEFYQALLENPHRISALYLRGHVPQSGWNLLQLPLPNITEVELFFEMLDEQDEMLESPARNGNIQNFLGGHTSSLRKLSLKNFTWRQRKFPALTHLHLTNGWNDESFLDNFFFAVLHSLSSTLQSLYLENAGPILEVPYDFPFRYGADKISMPVLKHLEMRTPFLYDDTNGMLLLLRNLSLPDSATIVWCRQWSDKLHKFQSHQWGKAILPPPELLKRVSTMVGWARRKDCYVLSGQTLYVDLVRVNSLALEVWPYFLPSFDTLLLQHHYCDNDGRFLVACSRIKSLHIWSHHTLDQLLVALEENDAKLCRELETLTVYTEHLAMWVDCCKKSRAELIKNKLPPLELDGRGVMIRRRLNADYTVCFKTGSISDALENMQLE